MDKLGAVVENDLEKYRSVGTDRGRCIRSDALFSQSNEIVIQHQGEHYRLRLTCNNKLILTK
jgi:hemin uptake protein HemP